MYLLLCYTTPHQLPQLADFGDNLLTLKAKGQWLADLQNWFRVEVIEALTDGSRETVSSWEY